VQRKTVTVLFCDVVGSTALGESVDPEALRALLARYFERMSGIVERHGGSVEKFIGDAVMAVFGVPAVHEDDALRALRAAVEMRAAFPELGIDGRIGVNTGEVVTGTEERLATGDAVNVAARLQQAAAPGEVLIGDATRRLARDAAEVEPVAPLDLKGKSVPLQAFRLLGVREGVPAFRRRLDSPLVGRERERRLLREAFERSRDERACSLFTILGPAGIGKSRLVGDLLDSIEGEARIVSARCLSYGDGITYWPLLEILAQFGRELEIRTPEETAWAARKLLEEIAAERPLVALFDDVQWAEATFLDLLEHIADLSRGAPILLLCVARQELLDTRPTWGGGKLNATTILLEPLGIEDVAALIENLGAEVSAAARAKIAEAAEGNPLFVEEMLAMLGENGDEPEVPPTIHALLEARLDRLDPSERDVLGRASVEGKVFHLGAVSTLAPDAVRADVTGHLLSLVRKELIRPDRPTFAGEDAFRFRHLLFRDAAYQSLSKAARAELHERFADWLERVVQDDSAEYEAIVGYHLEQAYRYRIELGFADDRTRQLGARAASSLGGAGLRAVGRADLPAAVNLLGRAAALLPGDSLERLRLLPDLGEALTESGRLSEAEVILAEAVERSARAGAQDVEARALIQRLDLRLLSDPEGRVEETRGEVERLLPQLEELGDERALARAWRAICATHLIRCEFDELERVAGRYSSHAERSGDSGEIDRSKWFIGTALVFGRTPVEEAIARHAALPLPHSAAWQAGREAGLGLLYGMAGRYAEARELNSRGRAFLHELGLEVTWAATAMAAAWIELWAGEPEAAERVAREGCDTLVRMGERSYLSTTSVVLAEALYDLGREGEAEDWVRIGAEAGSSDDLTTQVGWREVQARVLARRRQIGEAEALAREAIDIADRGESLIDQGSARLALAEVLRLAARKAEAASLAEEALRRFEQKGVVGLAERARAFLAQPAQPPATA
jgi:class 3 adenylate cyclase/tetratricopeptide (TPR) repeat protein